jgi:hypothetical protein
MTLRHVPLDRSKQPIDEERVQAYHVRWLDERKASWQPERRCLVGRAGAKRNRIPTGCM